MWLYKMEKYGVIKNESLKVKVKIIEADFFVWVVSWTGGIFTSKNNWWVFFVSLSLSWLCLEKTKNLQNLDKNKNHVKN